MPKSPRDRDPHRDAVYAWEDQWAEWNRNLITISQCRKLIRAACDHYRVKYPVVVQHPQRSFSWCIPSISRISLQGGEHRAGGGRNVATALHEAAHHICWVLHGDSVQDHGPTFVGIYMELLARAQVAPRTALEASAKAQGLRWVKISS